LTTLSCFAGIFAQAIINNLTAILFIPFMELFGLRYIHLGILVGINFGVQVSADILFSGLIDRIGFRRITITTCIVAFLGLTLFGFTPNLFPGNEYLGFILATVVFAFANGLLEVILSPIIDAIPNEDKGPAMSLMHSFYAWGQVATIVLTTLVLFWAGNRFWQGIVFFWALIPLTAAVMFYFAVMPPNSAAHTRQKPRELLRSPFYRVALVAILFGGATEVTMNQWASTYLNGALQIDKVVGDLLGMCGFAVMLGLGRVAYGVFGGKRDLNRILVLGSGFTVLCYLVVALSPWNALNVAACALAGLFSAILWPGVLVISSARFPLGGAWMFAILAAAGDIGAGVGPYLTGVVTDSAIGLTLSNLFITWYDSTPFGSTFPMTPTSAMLRLAILVSVVFPLGAWASHLYLSRNMPGRVPPPSRRSEVV
jgi:MFS family permease